MEEQLTDGKPYADGEALDASARPTDIGRTGDPDIDAALELVSATFANQASAETAFRRVRDAEKAEELLLVDAAVVIRDQNNNLHVQDEHDWSGRVGALLGAGIGTILGTIGGPLGLVVGGAAGAAIGAAAASGSDAGLADEKLKEFGNTLTPGSSMVILVVARMWSAAATALLTASGGQVNTTTLTDDMARALHVRGTDV